MWKAVAQAGVIVLRWSSGYGAGGQSIICVTVTLFLHHLVQGTQQYTLVNRILLYAGTSFICFCSQYVSLLLWFYLSLLWLILCFLTKLKKIVQLVPLRMVLVEVFLAFSAIAALSIGIRVGPLWTSREEHRRSRSPVWWGDRYQLSRRRGRAPKHFGCEPTQFKKWTFAVWRKIIMYIWLTYTCTCISIFTPTPVIIKTCIPLLTHAPNSSHLLHWPPLYI